MAINLKGYTKCIERTDSVKAFLRNIRHYPVLDAEEERELYVKYEEARDNNDEKMAQHYKTQIVNGNSRFIYTLAKKYADNNNVLDLVSQAYIGMDIAFREGKYDYKTGNRFCSYASWYMRREIVLYLINNDPIVKKTNKAKNDFKIKKAKDKFFVENGREPIETELLNILEEEYDTTVKSASELYDVQVDSINGSIGVDKDGNECSYCDNGEFAMQTAYENEAVKEEEHEYTSELVKALLSSLKEKDRDIMEKLYGIGCTARPIDEIADDYGMTTERIRQIKVAALHKLKQFNVANVSL